MTAIATILLFSATTLTNVSQVIQAVRSGHRGALFDLTGTVTFASDTNGISRLFTVRDATGTYGFHDLREGALTNRPFDGALLRFSGFLSTSPYLPVLIANATEIETLAALPTPPSIEADPTRIDTGAYEFQRVTLTGTVRDAHIDEIDNHTHFVILDCKTALIPLVLHAPDNRTKELRRLIGRTVTVDGLCHRPSSTKRTQTEYVIYLRDADALRPDTETFDPFAVPEARTLLGLTPRALCSFGFCKVSGNVLAVWQGTHLLLRSGEKLLTNVTLAEPVAPAVGQHVDASGFAGTDLYRLTLENAVWRPAAASADNRLANTNDPASAAAIFSRAADGRTLINPSAHGKTVRLSGVVKVLSKAEATNGTFSLAVDDTLLTVDVSSAPAVLDGLVEGCTVDVTGLCVVDTESWQPSLVMPRVRGVRLVVRQDSDLTVLACPPWWTRTRLLFALILVLIGLCGIAVWNQMLRRLVERRGRQLFRAQIDRASAVLRVQERSRLATELHDALSQSLAAFACELTAVRRGGKTDPTAAIARLPALERMLQSCRTGLRQCLYDLRSHMLDEPDFAKVIRQAVEQLGPGDTRLRVRFAFSRARLCDTTAHAVVCIVRELVSNALRHGRATDIKVAGALEDGKLLFSVADNGGGFDPVHRAGPETGHFGLDGIGCRIRNLNGTFDLHTRPDAGTRAVITIPLPDITPNEEA